MTLTAIAGANQVDIEKLAKLTAHDGWGPAPMHLITRRGAFQHGDTVVDYRLDPRVGQLVFVLPTSQLADMYNLRREILAIFAPQNRLALKWELPYGDRQIDCRVLEGGMAWQVSDWAAQKTSFSFYCSDPSFYDPAGAAVSFGLGGSSSSGVVITAAGRFVPTISGATYYVSPSGNDANPGTLAAPFKTIGYAYSRMVVTDRVYVRDGTYRETLDLNKSGSDWTHMFHVMAYPGEHPVIDGTNLGTASYNPLVMMSGTYNYFQGIEVANSTGMGVMMRARYNCIADCKVHECYSNGILVGGDYSIAEWNEVYNTATQHLNGAGSTWASALSGARELVWNAGTSSWDVEHTDHVIIRGNHVHHGWGEGLSFYEATYSLMEDNIVHDHWSANLYVSDAAYCTIRRNYVYMDWSITTYNTGSNAGIMIGNENNKVIMRDNIIVSNLVVHCGRNFYAWFNTGVGLPGYLLNTVISNNTFVESRKIFCIQINDHSGATAHTNSSFENNIIVQDAVLYDANGVAYTMSFMTTEVGLTRSHNIWSRTPPASCNGAGDYIGDPLLAKTGSVLQMDYYAPTGLSYAVGNSTVAADAVLDINRVARDAVTPTIGAIEYTAGLPAATEDNAFEVPTPVPTGVGASNIDQSISVDYPGTWPAFPLVRITGPVTDCVVTNETTGDKLDLTGTTIEAGHFVEIDCRYGIKTVKLDGATDHNDYLTADSDLATWSFQPPVDGSAFRTNAVRVTGDAASDAASIDITYFVRYNGI